MNIVKKNSAWFILLILSLCLLNILYVFTMQQMPSVYLFVVLFLVFTYCLAESIKFIFIKFEIKSCYTTYFLLITALLLSAYVKWNCFFGYQYAKYELLTLGYQYDFIKDFKFTSTIICKCIISPKYFFDDLVLFNNVGTWGIVDKRGFVYDFVKGFPLAMIWVSEFVLLMIYPIFNVKKHFKDKV